MTLPAAGGNGRRPPLDAVDASPTRFDRTVGSATVLRSVEEVGALHDRWLELCGDSVDTDPDCFLWSLQEENVVRPHVLALGGDAAPATIVAGRITDIRLPCRLGKATVYAPSVRALCVVRRGVLGRVDATTAAAIVAELRAALGRGDADVVVFRQLERGSTLDRALAAEASFAARRQHAARMNLRWQIDLPPTGAAYLGSLSPASRKAARRTAVRLAQQFGDRLAIRVFRDAVDVDECLDDLEAVAARAYQRRLGVGYLGDDRQRARLRMVARNGWFFASVLYLDGRPVAFELGELYGGRFNSLAGAYDPAYGRFRVGAYLLLETIGALADAGVPLFDFGFGDAPYKRKLGHRASEEGDFVLYARRPRPLAISFTRTALLELSRLLTASLDRLDLLERLRRRSRRARSAQPGPVLDRVLSID